MRNREKTEKRRRQEFPRPQRREGKSFIALAKVRKQKESTARPAKANADQGNNGKSHGCG